MEKLQMTENLFNPIRSSSSEPQRNPSKRRKLDTTEKINSPHVNENHRELKSLRTYFRSRLSHIGTSTRQLENIRKEIQKLFENEAKKLEIQAQVDMEILDHLERHLNIDNTPRDPLEPRAHAEVDLSPIKTPMKQKLLDLLPEHTRLKKNLIFSGFGGTPTSPDTPCSLENHPEALKTLKDLSNKITTIPHPQKSPKKIESKCMVRIERLNTEKILREERKNLPEVNDLENELKSCKDTISTLREALKDKVILEQQVADLRKALKSAKTREQKLKSRCEELSSRVKEYECRTSGRLSVGGKRGERPQKMESSVRAEDGELGSQVEVLESGNEELRRKVEGEEQRVELMRDEPCSNSHGDGENYSIDEDEEFIDVVGGDFSDHDGESTKTEERRISVGLLYIAPSSQSYFDIDFDAEYERQGNARFACCSCAGIYNTKPKIIDHLWSVHHQGRWHCPYCSRTAGDRYDVVQHMKKQHRWVKKEKLGHG